MQVGESGGGKKLIVGLCACIPFFVFIGFYVCNISGYNIEQFSCSQIKELAGEGGRSI